MQVFGIVVALILLASLAFIPIAALLVWLVVAASCWSGAALPPRG